MIKVINEDQDISNEEIASMINQINKSDSKNKLSALTNILDKVKIHDTLTLKLSDVELKLERISEKLWKSSSSNHEYSTYDIANKIIKNKYIVTSIL